MALLKWDNRAECLGYDWAVHHDSITSISNGASGFYFYGFYNQWIGMVFLSSDKIGLEQNKNELKSTQTNQKVYSC